MMIKYRANEVAKDFDITSKDVAGMLAPYFTAPVKTMTALEEPQLDIVFELLTRRHEVPSFETYFAEGESARRRRAEEKEREKAEMLARQAALAEQMRAEMAARAAAVSAPPTAKQPEEKPAVKPAPAQQAARGAVPPKPAASPKPAAPPKPVVQKPHGPSVPPPPLNRPKGEAPRRGPTEVRTVDTSKTAVNLDRYNEKYEQIAPAQQGRRNQFGGGKQKIKQKSQAYRGRPQGIRRETEAERLRRLQLERIKKTPIKVSVGENITVGELASRMKKTAAEVVKKLMTMGEMVSVSDIIDFDTAALVATELGAKVEREVVVTIEDRIIDDTTDAEETLKVRDPVVVVMGHVDHGKTSLLDAIRNADVTSTEAGGITQHIGAYRVHIHDRDITFLDTPGHEAFTAMRQRGAQVTDVAVLVVAADDGIMPQTVEAIHHAKAAGVQIIVAINKIDRPGANPDTVMQQLTEYELVPEEWGGETICVPVSAKEHTNIDKLLESILLVSDMLELRANADRRARGAVIEARLDKGRGPVATLLVQNGTLHVGDVVVAGTAVGRVRAMFSDRGERVPDAGPSVPVEVDGLAEAPAAGDAFDAVSDEKLARELVEQRKAERKELAFGQRERVTLDNLFDQLGQGEIKDLNLVVKADVRGSVEAVKQALERLSGDEVRVSVIHGGVGAINESDVMLASASGAIVVGFNVRPEPLARQAAERSGVDMRLYRVIYECIEEMEAALKGMLAPKHREVEQGRIEVRQVYKISGVGTIAGCYVLDGKVVRSSRIRVVRDGIVVAEDEMDSLRRFKDDVREVAAGYECGIGLKKFADIKEGDIFEAFIIEEYRD